jgi:hypothetical protein
VRADHPRSAAAPQGFRWALSWSAAERRDGRWVGPGPDRAPRRRSDRARRTAVRIGKRSRRCRLGGRAVASWERLDGDRCSGRLASGKDGHLRTRSDAVSPSWRSMSGGLVRVQGPRRRRCEQTNRRSVVDQVRLGSSFLGVVGVVGLWRIGRTSSCGCIYWFCAHGRHAEGGWERCVSPVDEDRGRVVGGEARYPGTAPRGRA